MGKWEMVRLGDVAPQKAAIFQDNGEKVWSLTLDMVESNTGRIIEYVYASSSDIGNSTVKFDEENVLYSKLRPYLNKVVIPTKKGVATSELIALRPVAQMLSREYLVYFLRSPFFVSFISEKVSGAKMPRVVSAEFFNSKLPLPPLDEQKRIAKNLDLASEIVKGYKEQLAELDKLVLSVFYEMFGDPVTNEKGWETGKLGDLCKFESGKAHENVVDENGQYILVTSRFIASDGLNFRKTNTVLSPLYIGDIVMVLSDVPNGKALAKCFLIDEDNKYTLNQRICVFRNESFDKQFLFCLLNRHSHFLSFNDGDSQTNLRKTDVLSCLMIVPPYETQLEFSKIVTEIETQKVQVQQALTEAENLFNSLMQEYFE